LMTQFIQVELLTTKAIKGLTYHSFTCVNVQ
jgi:hypothetical protein